MTSSQIKPAMGNPINVDTDANDEERKEISNQQQKLENSSESAGLARGAIRTATSISKRTAIGRLPTKVTPAVSATSRLLPRRLRIQQVAKVSDRLSTGFDAASSAIDTNLSGGSTGSTLEEGANKKSDGAMKNGRWDSSNAAGYVRKGIAFSGSE